MPCRLLAAGSNGAAQLGVGHRSDRACFSPCVFASAPAAPARIVALVSGAAHSLLLRADGQVWAAGSSTHGQLGPQFPDSSAVLEAWTPLNLDLLLSSAGLPTDIERTTVTYRAKHIACAWTTSFICFSRTGRGAAAEEESSDVILAFGSDDFGELGCGGDDDGGAGITNTKSQRRVQVVRLPGWNAPPPSSSTNATETTIHVVVRHMTVSQRHIVCVCDVTLAAKEEKRTKGETRTEQRVYGWGAARHGQLSPPPSTPTGISPSVPTASASSSSSLPTNNTQSTTRSRTRPPRSSYPAQYSLPVRIPLPYLVDQEEEGGKITHVALGARHTVLRLASGRILTMGDDTKSQLGGLPSYASGARYETVGCTWNGTVAALRRGGQGDGDVVVVSTGSNTHGQLGRPSSPSPLWPSLDVDLDPIIAKRVPMCCSASTHTAVTAHDDTSQAAARARGEIRLRKLVCGSEHVILLLDSPLSRTSGATAGTTYADADDDGEEEEEEGQVVVGWGWNEHGNLGLGHAEDQPTPVRLALPRFPSTVQGDSAAARKRPRVVDVWAGCGTTWVLLEVEDEPRP